MGDSTGRWLGWKNLITISVVASLVGTTFVSIAAAEGLGTISVTVDYHGPRPIDPAMVRCKLLTPDESGGYGYNGYGSSGNGYGYSTTGYGYDFISWVQHGYGYSAYDPKLPHSSCMEAEFTNVPVGTYRVEVWLDLNSNGAPDNGLEPIAFAVDQANETLVTVTMNSHANVVAVLAEDSSVVTGTVTDTAMNPVANANVNLSSGDFPNLPPLTATTNGVGSYTIPNVPTGTWYPLHYIVNASGDGYSSAIDTLTLDAHATSATANNLALAPLSSTLTLDPNPSVVPHGGLISTAILPNPLTLPNAGSVEAFWDEGTHTANFVDGSGNLTRLSPPDSSAFTSSSTNGPSTSSGFQGQLTTINLNLPWTGLANDGQGHVYFFGGGQAQCGAQYCTTIERLDVASGTVTTMNAHLPRAISETMAFWDGRDRPSDGCPGGCAYSMGGRYDTFTQTNEIVQYNPTTDTATLLTEKLPINIIGGAVVWTGQVAYIFGGYDALAPYPYYYDTIIKYDPVAHTVTTLAGKLPGIRTSMSAVWDGAGHAYMFGGITKDNAFVDDIARFDEATGTVTLVGHLPSARWNTGAAFDGRGNAYVAGGTDATQKYSDIIHVSDLDGLYDGVDVYGTGTVTGPNPIIGWVEAAIGTNQHNFEAGGPADANPITFTAGATTSYHVFVPGALINQTSLDPNAIEVVVLGGNPQTGPTTPLVPPILYNNVTLPPAAAFRGPNVRFTGLDATPIPDGRDDGLNEALQLSIHYKVWFQPAYLEIGAYLMNNTLESGFATPIQGTVVVRGATTYPMGEGTIDITIQGKDIRSQGIDPKAAFVFANEAPANTGEPLTWLSTDIMAPPASSFILPDLLIRSQDIHVALTHDVSGHIDRIYVNATPSVNYAAPYRIATYLTKDTTVIASQWATPEVAPPVFHNGDTASTVYLGTDLHDTLGTDTIDGALVAVFDENYNFIGDANITVSPSIAQSDLAAPVVAFVLPPQGDPNNQIQVTCGPSQMDCASTARPASGWTSLNLMVPVEVNVPGTYGAYGSVENNQYTLASQDVSPTSYPNGPASLSFQFSGRDIFRGSPTSVGGDGLGAPTLARVIALSGSNEFLAQTVKQIPNIEPANFAGPGIGLSSGTLTVQGSQLVDPITLSYAAGRQGTYTLYVSLVDASNDAWTWYDVLNPTINDTNQGSLTLNAGFDGQRVWDYFHENGISSTSFKVEVYAYRTDDPTVTAALTSPASAAFTLAQLPQPVLVVREGGTAQGTLDPTTGLFQSFDVTVPIEVHQNVQATVSTNVYGPNWVLITGTSQSVAFTPADTKLPASVTSFASKPFSQAGIDGPYHVEVVVTDAQQNVLDSTLITSPAYSASQFEGTGLHVVGLRAVPDGNQGSYSALTLQTQLAVSAIGAGTYTARVSISGMDWAFIDQEEHTVTLDESSATDTFSVAGPSVHKSGLNGPIRYFVEYFAADGTLADLLEGITPNAFNANDFAYPIQIGSASQFTSQAVQGNSALEIGIPLTVGTAGTYHVHAALYGPQQQFIADRDLEQAYALSDTKQLVDFSALDLSNANTLTGPYHVFVEIEDASGNSLSVVEDVQTPSFQGTVWAVAKAISWGAIGAENAVKTGTTIVSEGLHPNWEQGFWDQGTQSAYYASSSGELTRYMPGQGSSVTTINLNLPWTGLANDGQGHVYFFGGGQAQCGAQYCTTIERLDVASGTVTTMNAHLPRAISETMAFWDGRDRPSDGCPGGCAYSMGGRYDTFTQTNEIVQYNPTTDTATLLTEKLPINIIGGAVVWTGQVAYIFGGYDALAPYPYYYDTIIKYDPVAHTVTTLAGKLPGIRTSMSAVWDGAGHAYMFGGITKDNAFVDDIARFDEATGTVTLVGHLPSARWNTGAAFDGRGNAYVAGGGDGSTTFGDIVRFSIDPTVISSLTLNVPYTSTTNGNAFLTAQLELKTATDTFTLAGSSVSLAPASAGSGTAAFVFDARDILDSWPDSAPAFQGTLLVHLEARGADGSLFDAVDGVTQGSYSLSSFDHPASSATLASATLTAIDTSGDGRLDTLRASATVNVASGGTYQLDGTLYGPKGETWIASKTLQTTLSSGTTTVALDFSGSAIPKGIDGPYRIGSLRLSILDANGTPHAIQRLVNIDSASGLHAKDFA